MSDIIERVAKAIFDAGMSMHAPASWDKCNEGQRQNVRRQARAAIRELRDILNMTNNSRLNYTADELDQELRERT